MKKVGIHDIKPGMVLAREVRGMNGRLILNKGEIIEERHIRVLNLWAVAEITILLSSESADEESVLSEFMPQAQEHAEAFFAYATMTPPVEELKRQNVLLTAERLAEGRRIPSHGQPETDKGSASVVTSKATGATTEDVTGDVTGPATEATTGAAAEPDDTADSATPDASGVSGASGTSGLPSLQDLTDSDEGLVSVPDIYFQINEALKAPSCTAARLGDIISKDTGLTAKLLQLVNSPAFGFSGKIDSLSRGVVVLGVTGVSQLALGVSVMSMFENHPKHVLSVKEFWKHSLACGVFARLLALRCDLKDLERFFVTGMLHDVGMLVMFRLAPDAMNQMMMLAYQQRLPVQDAERIIFGFDHCQVAERLFKRWGLPETLTDMIIHHHTPSASAMPQEAGIINLADSMAVGLEYGFGGQRLFTGLNAEAWQSSGLSVSAIPVVVSQAKRQLTDIFSVFLG